MAAPSGRRRGIPQDHPRLWINPCGHTPSDEQPTHDMTLSKSDVLNNIIVQAVNALDSVQRFKDEYVMETFDLSFDDHHKNWKGKGYEWLFNKKQVPKELGKDIEVSQLDNVDLDSFLKKAYRLLQVMAVALEQVAWDQKYFLSESKYAEHFSDVEFKLRAVLCEIQIAMLELEISPLPDVGREVMPAEFREMKDDSFRNLRDWFIFRDYMTVLEYIRDVLQYLVSRPNRIR